MQLLLWALLIFQLKHFICDFLLQPSSMFLKKGIYLHPMGLLHAGVHVVGSIPAVLLLTHAQPAIEILLLCEFVIHYHTDWAKVQIDKVYNLGTNNSLYWAIFGADQLIHQITYLGMVYAILAFPAFGHVPLST